MRPPLTPPSPQVFVGDRPCVCTLINSQKLMLTRMKTTAGSPTHVTFRPLKLALAIAHHTPFHPHPLRQRGLTTELWSCCLCAAGLTSTTLLLLLLHASASATPLNPLTTKSAPAAPANSLTCPAHTPLARSTSLAHFHAVTFRQQGWTELEQRCN